MGDTELRMIKIQQALKLLDQTPLNDPATDLKPDEEPPLRSFYRSAPGRAIVLFYKHTPEPRDPDQEDYHLKVYHPFSTNDECVDRQWFNRAGTKGVAWQEGKEEAIAFLRHEAWFTAMKIYLYPIYSTIPPLYARNEAYWTIVKATEIVFDDEDQKALGPFYRDTDKYIALAVIQMCSKIYDIVDNYPEVFIDRERKYFRYVVGAVINQISYEYLPELGATDIKQRIDLLVEKLKG